MQIRIEFPYHASQRTQFADGTLVERWRSAYGEMFDEHDCRLAMRQTGYHFFEWLAAVLLRESTSYHSLIEKYETAKHARKVEIFRRTVFPKFPKVFEFAMAHPAGLPDLFVYRPETMSALHAFSAVTSLRGYNRQMLGELLHCLAMEDNNTSATQLSKLYLKNTKALWWDANVTGQCLYTLLFGQIGPQADPQLDESQVTLLTAQANAQDTAPEVPSWCLDGITSLAPIHALAAPSGT